MFQASLVHYYYFYFGFEASAETALTLFLLLVSCRLRIVHRSQTVNPKMKKAPTNLNGHTSALIN